MTIRYAVGDECSAVSGHIGVSAKHANNMMGFTVTLPAVSDARQSRGCALLLANLQAAQALNANMVRQQSVGCTCAF
jgi:hypothetical protein